jgi:hypothetical protein
MVGIEAIKPILIKTCAGIEGPYISYLASELDKLVPVSGLIVSEPP